MDRRGPLPGRRGRRRGALPRAAAFLFVLAVIPGGCAEPHRGPWEAPSPAALTLEVRNNNYLDVAIYAHTDGQHLRLGSVTGQSHATLEIPTSVVVRADGFRLEVDPVGARDSYVTERIVASPGAIVVLDVGSVLGMSSWHLR